jgi:hypothetical protein
VACQLKVFGYDTKFVCRQDLVVKDYTDPLSVDMLAPLTHNTLLHNGRWMVNCQLPISYNDIQGLGRPISWDSLSTYGAAELRPDPETTVALPQVFTQEEAAEAIKQALAFVSQK